MKNNVSKTLLMLATGMLLFASCQQKVKDENVALKAKIDSLQAVNAELKTGSKQLGSTVSSYEETLAEIDQTLADIASNQKEVNTLKGELKDDENTAKSIKARIGNIQEMMQASRQKILTLDRNLDKLRKQSGAKSEEILELDQKLKDASQALVQKEEELMEIRVSLEQQLADMGQALDEQISVSADLKSTLNRVYYYVGESKDLQEKNIVNKEGGFIGLGKVKMVNANAPTQLFNKANKESLNAIELNGREAKLISNHPADSYEFVGEQKFERLKIIDRDQFWKDSNYLVIEVK